MVRLPSHPIEVLIAVSILVSAVRMPGYAPYVLALLAVLALLFTWQMNRAGEQPFS